ncbi:MAG: hypothetical protein EOP38_26255 [Rubrivivax sp.]|nr:MAG: hypothetical protein EOP38_26255 [Rubrivivax sp.]
MSDFTSNGWSWFVIAIVVFGLVYCAAVLMGASRHKVIRDSKGNIEKTTGHVWDGDLRELNNPLPRWWLVLFILMFNDRKKTVPAEDELVTRSL